MRSRPRAPFVVTASVLGLSSASLACEPWRTQNPPRPEPVPLADTVALSSVPATTQVTSATSSSSTPASSSTPSASQKPIRQSDFTRQLNERDKNNQQIFSGGASGCFIYDRWPDGKPRAPGMMPPTIGVQCPPNMQDPAWQGCASGTLSTNDAGTECSCYIGGNPPPPPTRVACPANAKR